MAPVGSFFRIAPIRRAAFSLTVTCAVMAVSASCLIVKCDAVVGQWALKRHARDVRTLASFYDKLVIRRIEGACQSLANLMRGHGCRNRARAGALCVRPEPKPRAALFRAAEPRAQRVPARL